MFGTVDIGIISPATWRKIVDDIPHTGYYEFKKDSDANNMTVQQYYCETYNMHIK
ncbi:hypothetical protein SCLCIDRAFT_34707 [Scleroderma citrinum Foug A]|uniref:Uncharacterized protein n=1 Tax=Scleroderma citrinum Foug A TaxID=1036808 RepID=A0A0C3CN06_9AGAM|nr:hypothetical protein SCLCIDRAFT_34707 [Scleroderma citrinum Foug A]